MTQHFFFKLNKFSSKYAVFIFDIYQHSESLFTSGFSQNIDDKYLPKNLELYYPQIRMINIA